MNIGAIGTSFIMDTILENMKKVPGIHCQAIYSRNREKGQVLADKFSISKVYTSLEEMCQDSELDWIYVASPNSLHYTHAKTALEYGKHVLCEKPFTPSAKEAAELIALAKEKHLFLWEAIITLFHPNYKRIEESLPLIGKLKMVLCTFCQYSSRYEALLSGQTPNVFNPEFAGGALMDLNLYNIYFTLGLFGKPEHLQYFPTLYENGIDTNGILVLQYPDFLCQCTGAKDAAAENSVQILGDKGYIRVTPGSSNCRRVEIVRRGEADIIYEVDEAPWYYEMDELYRLVQNNDYDECYRRLDIALSVVEVLENSRKSAGLNF